MADHLPRLSIVSYDIRDPKRLGQVHRYLVKHGLPLQYSVFLLSVNPVELEAILEEIAALIEPRVDDVRAYPLPRSLEYSHLGRQLLPLGVTLTDAAIKAGMLSQAA